VSFWITDAGPLFLDFGLPLTKANGDTTKAIFDHEEALVDDGTGQRMEEQQVFRYKTAGLTLVTDDVVDYDNTGYVVREVYLESDGVTSKAVVVPS